MPATIHGFPVPCDCGKHLPPRRLPLGMMHTRRAPCPLVSREHQWEVKQGTCCTTELGSVAAILSSSGEATLAAHLLAPMTAEEAAAFAGELEGYATSLVDGNAGEPEDEEGWKFLRDCETLLAAASWFGKLGEAGFGVVAGRSPGRTYPRSSKRRAA